MLTVFASEHYNSRLIGGLFQVAINQFYLSLVLRNCVNYSTFTLDLNPHSAPSIVTQRNYGKKKAKQE